MTRPSTPDEMEKNNKEKKLAWQNSESSSVSQSSLVKEIKDEDGRPVVEYSHAKIVPANDPKEPEATKLNQPKCCVIL